MFNYTITKQIKSFFLIGIFSFIIDAGIYYLLISKLDIGILISKTFSFLCGTLNSYIFNRYLTFRSNIRHDIGISKHYLLYGMSLFFNVNINYFIYINLADVFDYAYHAAFIIATGVSVVINFIGLKFFVFKK